MTLSRALVPGQGVTWVGPPLAEQDGGPVQRGERGVFVDHDGRPDLYVVTFPGGRTFCCHSSDVEPDLPEPARVVRRHNAT